MATFSKPADIPNWADDLVNNVDPGATKSNLGWLFEEIPASSFENFRAQLVGQWFKWINERFNDGATDNVLQILNPDDGTVAIDIDGPDQTIRFPTSGLMVGASTSNVAPNLIAFNDTTTSIGFDGTDASWLVDTFDRVFYDRSENSWKFAVALEALPPAIDRFSHTHYSTDAAVLRQPIFVSPVRDGATDPGAEGLRLGHMTPTTPVTSFTTLNTNSVVMEITDGAASTSGGIIFAETPMDGSINALLVIQPGGNLMPGKSTGIIGSPVFPWDIIVGNQLVADPTSGLPSSITGSLAVDSTQGNRLFYDDGIGFQQVLAPVKQANSVISTIVAAGVFSNTNLTVPGGTLQVGDSIEFTFGGTNVLSSGIGTTQVLEFFINGAAPGMGVVFDSVTGTSVWFISLMYVVESVGVTGSLFGAATITSNASTFAASTLNFPITNLDTTSDILFQLNATAVNFPGSMTCHVAASKVI